ncbi:hypothetical protein BH24ACT24_BH24ACT24_08660 [soil metagenome]
MSGESLSNGSAAPAASAAPLPGPAEQPHARLVLATAIGPGAEP